MSTEFSRRGDKKKKDKKERQTKLWPTTPDGHPTRNAVIPDVDYFKLSDELRKKEKNRRRQNIS